MKKTLALLLAFVLVFSTLTVAFADEATIGADAKAITEIGMLKGDNGGVTADYLTTVPTRIQAAVMFLRLKGLEAEAQAFNGEANFADADQAEWAKPIMAYLKANPSLGWIGDGTNFNPNKDISVKEYYKVMLEALDYKQNTAEQVGDFTWDNVIEFAASKGLVKVATAATFTVNDLATATVEALKANVKGVEKTLVATLIDTKKIDAAKAEANGLYTPVPVVTAVKVASAASLTSKVIEVGLSEAATKVDATLFTVKDAAGTAVEVAAAELAGWDTDNETVLVTLKADTKVGTLYTITSGTTNANFGGKAADTTKPTVAKVEATDYNQVAITFSEPVKLDGAKVAIAEKYGTKAALNFSAMNYDTNNVIVLTTDAQKGATLYGTVIENVTDLAGNVMTKDEAKTFVGKVMPTDTLVVKTATATDYNEVTVDFNINVDPATIVATAFKIEEAYGTNKATVAVTGAALKTNKTSVKLTVDGTMKAATLYKLTVTGLKTLYGKDMSTTAGDTYKTFTGVVKPTGKFGFANTKFEVTSNTTIVLHFARKVDATVAEVAANYAIVEAYGTKAALEVKTAKVATNGTDVTLTVAPMKTVLYKATVSNMKDIYGNAMDADNNTFNFSGLAVATKIAAIASIVRTSDTTIVVTFDQNVGDTAVDVAHYVIDKNVGYPEKAEITDVKEVTLTIPKTAVGIYTLTVKGLENADGVAMAADGVSATFIGAGADTTLPELVAAMPMDTQTLKVFFDRDVTDATIDGIFWNSDDNTVTADLQIKGKNNATYTLFSEDAYAYQDAENANALIVRIDLPEAFVSANAAANGAFELFGTAAKFADADKATLQFAPTATEPQAASIDAVVALNNETIRVYFDKPVYPGSFDDFARVFTGATKPTNYAADTNELINYNNIDSTYRVYDFALTTPLDTTGTYWLMVNPAVDETILNDSPAGNGVFTIKDEDTTTDPIDQVRQFAGTTTEPVDVKDIPVMMTDEKTIVVYYPELMSADVLNKANYNIVTAANAAVTMTGDDPFTTANIAKITAKRDGSNTVATITLNNTINATSNAIYLAINTATANATKTATVVDNLKTQFAISNTASAKVVVSSATYVGKTLTLKFSQPVDTANNLTVAANLVAALTVKFNKANGTFAELKDTDIAGIVAKDAAGVGILDTRDGNVSTIEITLTDAFIATFVANQVGKVQFNADALTTALIGLNGNGIDKAAVVEFRH